MVNVQSKFEKINRLKAKVDGFRPFDTAIAAELKRCHDVRFTHHSNALDGNTLTHGETELILTQGLAIGGKALDEHWEAIGHQEAIDYITALAQVNTAIREWEIKQIHHLMLRKLYPHEAGRYRTVTTTAAANCAYPSPAVLPQVMGDFVDWLNSPSALALHPVEYATQAYCQLLSIQPFREGNGRMGRLLLNWLLLRAGYPMAVITTQVHHDYVEALVDETPNQNSFNQNSLEQLLVLVCETVIQSLVELLEVLAATRSSQGQGEDFHQEMLAFMAELGEL